MTATYTETPEMTRYRLALEFKEALIEALQGREPSESERRELLQVRSMIIKSSMALTMDQMKAVLNERSRR